MYLNCHIRYHTGRRYVTVPDEVQKGILKLLWQNRILHKPMTSLCWHMYICHALLNIQWDQKFEIFWKMYTEGTEDSKHAHGSFWNRLHNLTGFTGVSRSIIHVTQVTSGVGIFFVFCVLYEHEVKVSHLGMVEVRLHFRPLVNAYTQYTAAKPCWFTN
jgi:hypothetical protein